MATSPATTNEWTVADLASLYSEYRLSLISQARRMLRSDSEANEVVQEAFIKFILAAPELDTKERALAYMRATINNLSLNVIRARGSRPNLVALEGSELCRSHTLRQLFQIYIPQYIVLEEIYR